MPNWKKIALSGSNPEFASLTVDNAIQAGTVSGSFSGSYVGDGSSLTGLSLPQVATVTDTFTSTTSKTVTHNFSTKNVIVQVYDNDDNIIIPQQVTTTDTNTVDITLQNSQTQCWGKRSIAFTLSDTFTPDLPVQMFTYLLNEAKSAAFLTLKQMANQKAEQISVSQRRRMSQDAFKIEKGIKYPNYGRNRATKRTPNY